jgi:hypothetical protein
MSARLAAALLVLTVATSASGCSTLLGAEPTPVPGAAATLTRSSRTPIPTPTRDSNPSPVASPAVARSPLPVAASASPGPGGRPVTQDEIAQMQREMDRLIARQDLPDVETLLLDRVSLSTPAGGQVLDRASAAQWLRDHAGPGVKVTRVDPNTQTVLLEVQTDGWPKKDPLQEGRVTFNMRRYAANGRQDEDNGDWKIDVIGAE